MTDDEPPVRLNELDRQEMRDLARALKPEMTDEQFEQSWQEFQALKAQRLHH